MKNISYDDFSKLDIKIGEILSVEKVPKTDRLLKFEINLGNQKRIIIGGWAEAYSEPSILIGKQVPVLANLESRKIRGVESQGMILAATFDNLPVAILPEKKVENGSQIK